MSLKHEHTLNPISALEFYHVDSGALLVLAGEGSYLKVFEAETSKLLCQCKVFHSQTIHGIAVRENVDHEDDLQVAIWGGSCLTLLKKSQFQKTLDQSVGSITDAAVLASDWILDGAISPHGDTCVLVTAHNTVLQARLLKQEVILETLNSPSRSILYSAHIIWESTSDVLVAAGTVFGEIIVWQCSVSEEINSQPLFIFRGHEGSIFGVNISPPITHPDGSVNRLLVSCSDDRTIRVWDLKKDSTDALNIDGLVVPRETGFSEESSRDTSTSTTRALATVMGHASRIWRVKFLVKPSKGAPPLINIISFGEDSTTQQWELNLGHVRNQTETVSSHLSESTITLINKHIFSFHAGKHIWSAACLQPDETQAIIATGGADGKISLYNIKTSGRDECVANIRSLEDRGPDNTQDVTSKSSSWFSSFDLDDILDQLPNLVDHKEGFDDQQTESKYPPKQKTKKVQKDAFNRYSFVSENIFLATTNFGRILLGEIKENDIKWQELSLSPSSETRPLKSYSVLKGFPGSGIAILAGTSGTIYGFELGSTISEIGCVESKVADILTIHASEEGALSFLATTLASQTATLFTIKNPFSQTRQHSHTSYTLPERFVVTSAGKSNQLLILGSRNGSIAVYDPQVPQAPLTVWEELAATRDAITTILPLPTHLPSADSKTTFFLTTSRDGQYSIFCLNLAAQTNINSIFASLHPIHHGTPPFGPMIKNGWFQGNDLILYGFKSKNFVVWNETKGYEISSIECGGAHRSYSYSPFAAGQGNGHFIYTKASKLYIHTQRKPSHAILKHGGHGREIKACAVSPDGFIATGAEDTAIRIWHYKTSESTSALENGFVNQAVVMKHTTGIQHLQFHGSKYLFSSGGNEEFFIWALQPIPGFGIGAVCEASCPDQSPDQDLRVMSFDVSDEPGETGKLIISLAYSDSTIRVYTYSKRDGFDLVGTGRYTSSCLTQIRHLQVSVERLCLLTAGTDGKIVLWNLALAPSSSATEDESVVQKGGNKLEFLSRTTVHQNTIKALDVQVLDDCIVVVTGGDDNAIGVTIYPSIDPLTRFTRASVFRFAKAHAAAITGLCLRGVYKDEDGDRIRVVSSGNDQRVKGWGIGVRRMGDRGGGGFGVEIEMVGDEWSSVADVGDLAAFGGGRVVVVGNGMEVWEGGEAGM